MIICLFVFYSFFKQLTNGIRVTLIYKLQFRSRIMQIYIFLYIIQSCDSLIKTINYAWARYFVRMFLIKTNNRELISINRIFFEVYVFSHSFAYIFTD